MVKPLKPMTRIRQHLIDVCIIASFILMLPILLFIAALYRDGDEWEIKS